MKKNLLISFIWKIKKYNALDEKYNIIHKEKQIISEDIIYKNKNTEIICIYAYNNKTNN